MTMCRMISYDGLQQVLSWANANQKFILLGDFESNINPLDGANDEVIVGPYDCWKRPTNEGHIYIQR